MKDKKRGVDTQAVTGALRHGVELIEHGDVAGAVDDIFEHAHVGERVEHTFGVGRPTREQRGEERHEPVPTTSTKPAVAPSSPAVTVAKQGYICATPWSRELADVVVICCSSEKYELQNQELVKALGYTMPHFIQVPGGPASLYGLAAVSGFLTKAMGAFVDKAVDLLGVKELILIAHEDCGAYKAGRVEVLAQLTRRLSGKNMKNVQIEHLQKGARDLQARAGHGIEVLAFYGSILDNGSFKQIRYEPVDFASRVRA